MIAFFYKISHGFFLSNRAMMDVTMRRKCPSTSPAQLTSALPPDLLWHWADVSLWNSMSFVFLQLPVKQLHKVYVQTQIGESSLELDHNRHQRHTDESTTAGSSVEGGWCGHRWIRNNFKTIMSVMALPSRASARGLRSIVWIISGQNWTLSPSEICINSPNLSCRLNHERVINWSSCIVAYILN